MIVYRVEHKEDKLGPYWSHYQLVFDHNDNDHPGRYYDFHKRSINEDMRSCFLTEEDVKSWFTESEIQQMLIVDFEIVRYKVSSVIVGKSGKQAIFNINDAERLS